MRKVFADMFAITPTAANARVYSKCNVKADVSGYVELQERQVHGTLVLSFPEETIYALLERFYKKPFHEVNNSVQSSVGELTNILYTMVKKSMNETGSSLKSAIPSVIVGSDQHNEFCNFACTTLAIDFSTSFGRFTVYANLDRDAAQSAA
ncbi:MAG: chemotaxis protein CheX [Bdellovibrionota bacterium]